ncbi:hypothetical protein [Geomonas anaerohicana]|uniref:Uncharacterized protein n=1 Tax=Geomonas anaerohicana TaxID=2798583 RepID=A0ABS0YBR2_9BACT|nr:hypothetical protein [Geomonas anaerohicana]MBJ6749359.1 hypothetical protein [Geomonas anaerohicana]
MTVANDGPHGMTEMIVPGILLEAINYDLSALVVHGDVGEMTDIGLI